MSSPTSRTLDRLRSEGFVAQVVERWNPHARIRVDLFGCIDVLAVHAERRLVLGVQACAGGSHAAREAKAETVRDLRTWLVSGGVFEVWSWAKRGARGRRKLWTRRRTRAFLHGDAIRWESIPEEEKPTLPVARGRAIGRKAVRPDPPPLRLV